MINRDALERELVRFFGEDASLASTMYLETLQVLQQLALSAQGQNTAWSANKNPSLAKVFTLEADVFSEVARELRRATARIKDTLDGFTSCPRGGEGNPPCNS